MPFLPHRFFIKTFHWLTFCAIRVIKHPKEKRRKKRTDFLPFNWPHLQQVKVFCNSMKTAKKSQKTNTVKWKKAVLVVENRVSAEETLTFSSCQLF